MIIYIAFSIHKSDVEDCLSLTTTVRYKFVELYKRQESLSLGFSACSKLKPYPAILRNHESDINGIEPLHLLE